MRKNGVVSTEILVIVILLMSLISHDAWCGVIRVPEDYTQIGMAVYVAGDGTEIIVSPGTYDSFGFQGKILNVHSIDPTDWNIVKSTIVQGGSVSVVGVGPGNSRLAGFTIRGGGTGVIGGGVGSIIENNYIVGNNAPGFYPPGEPPSPRVGGGIKNSGATIRNNIIEFNDADNGSTLYACSGIIENNIIARNPCTYSGATIYNCTGIIRNNTIINNYNFRQLPDSSYEVMEGNKLVGCLGQIFNNIIWMTEPNLNTIFSNCSDPSFSCIKGLTTSDQGNISLNPNFENVVFEGAQLDPAKGRANDYHLKVDSPCIDAGTTSGSLTTDIEGIPRGVPGQLQSRGDDTHVDIGAYEFRRDIIMWIPDNSLPAKSNHYLSVDWVQDPAWDDQVYLELIKDGLPITQFGAFQGLIERQTYAEPNVTLVFIPRAVSPGPDYVIRGRSAQADDAPTFDTAPFEIQAADDPSAAGPAWTLYP